ncbi:hypothetical protein DFP72DRAFT_1082482 [Ephemerocybe angulata]|uniref:Uncharacterized protein n=1 Tax=Ephemerocybe angulata TaxID=980116 RepID=A0A8H6H843_9AGAR|nr:hypothetical protein DFP72DRAFT_1082482 [Tulosesus angulatus]
MPVTRLHTKSPTQSPTSTGKITLGPFADKHPSFHGIKHKKAAQLTVNRLLRDAAEQIAYPRPTNRTPHHKGHGVTGAVIYSSTKLENFGRWYQVCSDSNAAGCNAPRFITDAPSHDLIWDNEDLLRLLIIREEIFPATRGVPSEDKKAKIAQHEKNLRLLRPYIVRLGDRTPSKLVAKPHPMLDSMTGQDSLQAPTGSGSRTGSSNPSVFPSKLVLRPVGEAKEVIRQFMYNPSANIFYWNEAGECLQTTLFPDESGFIRLSKSRLPLGEAGIEILTKVERYIFERDSWVPFPTSMPIGPIEAPGYPLFFKVHTETGSIFFKGLHVVNTTRA